MTELKHFFYMGGYGWYVWLAYGSVLSVLFSQWLLSWRRWKNSGRKHE